MYDPGVYNGASSGGMGHRRFNGASSGAAEPRRFNGASSGAAGYNRNSNRRCYACSMVGHVASECWNANLDSEAPFENSNRFQLLDNLCNCCDDEICDCKISNSGDTESTVYCNDSINNIIIADACQVNLDSMEISKTSCSNISVLSNEDRTKRNHEITHTSDINSRHNQKSDTCNSLHREGISFHLKNKGINFGHLNIQGICG